MLSANFWLIVLLLHTGPKVRTASPAARGYMEDITRWREDMNFIFEWQNNILRTSAASE